MTNVLLSCLCKWEFHYASPPVVGDELICRSHGVVSVIGEPWKLECVECEYQKEYPALAKNRVCITATKHLIRSRHTVRHYMPFDRDGTMCLHVASKAPQVFTVGAPPF